MELARAGVAVDPGDVQGHGQRWCWGRLGRGRAIGFLDSAGVVRAVDLFASSRAPSHPLLIGGRSLTCMPEDEL